MSEDVDNDDFVLDEYEGPYEHWVFGNGQAYKPFDPDHNKEAFTCMVETPGRITTPLTTIRDGGLTMELPTLWANANFEPTFLPAVILGKDIASGAGFSALNLAFTSFFSEVEAEQAGQPKLAYRINLPLRTGTLNAGWREEQETLSEESPDGKEKIVIVAIIDDGVPFAHRNFTTKDGSSTRIDYCWSQSATAVGRPMLFGREFDREMINALYEYCDSDEEAIYWAAGLAGGSTSRQRFPLDKQHSHGAHVLDTLAGNHPGTGSKKEDDVHIIAVDLPAMISADTSGFGKDVFLLSAMHYIFDRAEKIAQKYAPGQESVPLVINLSYGHSAGPHDGTGVLETAFDEMIDARRKEHPTALVMPSGNMFLQNIHAVVNEVHFKKAGSLDLSWFVPPEDRTFSYVEIWYPDGIHPDDYKIELIPPCQSGLGSSVYKMPSAPKADKLFATNLPIKSGERPIGQVSTELYRAGRWRHVIALAPTESEEDLQTAPSGKWTIRLAAANKRATVPLPEFTGPEGDERTGGIQLWIQRDEDFGGAGTGARQSYFVDGKNELTDRWGAPRANDSTYRLALVRRFGTISGMATGNRTLRVGGYIQQSRAAAPYSCAGALRHKLVDGKKKPDPVGQQVEASAVSERSFMHPGLMAAGTRTGIYIALSGTSSAAPQIARALATVFLIDEYDAPDPTSDYSDLINWYERSEVVGNHMISDDKGQERLGRFIARQSRGPTDEDAQSRVIQIDKLVPGPRRDPR